VVAGEMAKHGNESPTRPGEQRELAQGEVVMPTVPGKPRVPFTPSQLARLDEALTLATRTTGLDFSVYLGDLDEDPRGTAEGLHASTGEHAPSAVLIAASPGQRVVEVVTGEESHRRVSDRGCKLAVMSMVASFKEGDLFGGLISGLRMLTDQAGSAPRH